ncbi:FAD:protein FMN transferase [Kitasatospora sp. A2-31]|nr:FAD:protein FMN transferase [Kitasatospora sp. A2-31]
MTLVTDPGIGVARTDAWTTAAFAMGPARALSWVTGQPGVEALAGLPDGTKHWTDGLPRHLPPGGPADWR